MGSEYELDNIAKRNVWIATIPISYGHERVARNLYEYFESSNIGSDILDISNSEKVLSQQIWQFQKRLLELISKTPLLSKLYTYLTHPAVSPRRNYGGVIELFNYLLDSEFIRAVSQSDVCVSTHYKAASLLSARIPVISYITDLIPHPAHVNFKVQKYAVPNVRSYVFLSERGISKSNIEVTGLVLPQCLVHNAYYDFVSRVNRLAKNNSLTILIGIGGAGAQTDTIDKTVVALQEIGYLDCVRLLIFLGDHKKIFDKYIEQFGGEVVEDCNIKNGISYVYRQDRCSSFELIEKLVKSVDVVISKPDIWLTYGYLGIPILATNPIGYQELVNFKEGISRGFVKRFSKELLRELLLDRRTLISMCYRGYDSSMIQGASRIKEMLSGLH